MRNQMGGVASPYTSYTSHAYDPAVLKAVTGAIVGGAMFMGALALVYKKWDSPSKQPARVSHPPDLSNGETGNYYSLEKQKELGCDKYGALLSSDDIKRRDEEYGELIEFIIQNFNKDEWRPWREKMINFFNSRKLGDPPRLSDLYSLPRDELVTLVIGGDAMPPTEAETKVDKLCRDLKNFGGEKYGGPSCDP